MFFLQKGLAQIFVCTAAATTRMSNKQQVPRRENGMTSHTLCGNAATSFTSPCGLEPPMCSRSPFEDPVNLTEGWCWITADLQITAGPAPCPWWPSDLARLQLPMGQAGPGQQAPSGKTSNGCYRMGRKLQHWWPGEGRWERNRLPELMGSLASFRRALPRVGCLFWAGCGQFPQVEAVCYNA